MYQSLKPCPAKDAPGLIGALRSATAYQHQAVEYLPVMLRLTSATVTPEDYRQYLSAIAAVYGTVEPALFAALAAGLPPERVSVLGLKPKFAALVADLQTNGLPIPPSEPPRAPPMTLSTALGGLYVLEGATLGGRIILRQLRRLLGERLVGDAFLDFHGERASAVWKGFGQCVDGLAAEGLIDPAQTIDGARTVFNAIYSMLEAADSTDRRH
jgi:heme oxygenase (biliverdin-IX-beta and delta-forming)